jgi:hypothetical protein
MKSLVKADRAQYRNRSPWWGSRIPNGVNLASALKSWSSASTLAQVRPAREHTPTFTLALASRDNRKVSSAASAWLFSSPN